MKTLRDQAKELVKLYDERDRCYSELSAVRLRFKTCYSDYNLIKTQIRAAEKQLLTQSEEAGT
jgi:hypothetical protein